MMSQPWTRIALETYEAHMALPEVGQARLLADELRRAVERHAPRGLALIGSAGGNGLDVLEDCAAERVLCVDVSAVFMQALRERYTGRVAGLECHVGEIETFRADAHVDLVFCGLLFEYTRLDEALRSCALLLRPGAVLVAVLQLPAENKPAVTPSPYAEELADLETVFRHIDPDVFIDGASAFGLVLSAQRTHTLPSGKRFEIIELLKAGSEATTR